LGLDRGAVLLVVRVWLTGGRVVGLRRRIVVVFVVAPFGSRGGTAGVAAGADAAAAFEAAAAAADDAEEYRKGYEGADYYGCYHRPSIRALSGGTM